MTEEKGLDPAVADKIGEYVNFKGGEDLLAKLEANETLVANEAAKKGLSDMRTMFTYLKIFGVLDKISLDMSLARGLDYYTGVIYEVVTEGSAPPSVTNPEAQKAPSKKKKQTNGADEDRSNDPTIGVGSVAAGGRYDEYVDSHSLLVVCNHNVNSDSSACSAANRYLALAYPSAWIGYSAS